MKRQLTLVLSLALVVALAAPAYAQGEQGASATAQFDKLKNTLTWGGYYEFEYEDEEAAPGSAGNGNFDQHRNILFFGAQPHERLRFFNELEIEHGGAPDVKFEQAWLEFAINDNHNLRAGIDLIPVGRLNVNHDGNMRDFVLRPRTSAQLIPTTWFESGIGFNGSLTDKLSYQVGISNGLNSNATSADTTGLQDNVEEFGPMTGLDLAEADGNGSKAYWGRFVFSPRLGTDIGLSGYQTRYNSTGSDSDIRFLAIDFKSVHGPWEFKGEYVDVEKDQEVQTDAAGNTARGIKGASGGYIEAAYHFFPDGMRDAWFAQGFDNPTFTALARHEQISFDERQSGGELDNSVTSIGINYRPVERMAFKAAYDIDSHDDTNGPLGQEQDRVSLGMVLGF